MIGFLLTLNSSRCTSWCKEDGSLVNMLPANDRWVNFGTKEWKFWESPSNLMSETQSFLKEGKAFASESRNTRIDFWSRCCTCMTEWEVSLHEASLKYIYDLIRLINVREPVRLHMKPYHTPAENFKSEQETEFFPSLRIKGNGWIFWTEWKWIIISKFCWLKPRGSGIWQLPGIESPVSSLSVQAEERSIEDSVLAPVPSGKHHFPSAISTLLVRVYPPR